MTKHEIIVLSVSVAYLVACLVVGMRPARRASSTTSGFVAGDRALGLFVMYFITGATIFSAFAFLGGPGWIYRRGVSAFYILAYGALGFFPFYFLGPRAARVGRVFGFVTQAEMVAHRFSSKRLQGVMAIISTVAFVPYLALQMKGAGYVLAVVTGGRVPEYAGAAIVYVVVLVYVLKSGVLGVGWTNTLQGLLMMGLAWGIGLWLPSALYGGVGEMFHRIAQDRPELLHPPGLDGKLQPWTWGEYSSAVIVSIVGFSVWPHVFMKAFTAKSDRVLKRTVVLYPTFQIFLVPLFLIGFAGVLFANKPADPDLILPHMLMSIHVSPWLIGLFCAGALAASMSSGDAMAHASASIIVRDFVVPLRQKRMDDAEQTQLIKILLVALMIVAYGVAILYKGSLVNLLLSAYGAVVQFMPTMIATLYLRRAREGGVLAGLIVGSLVTVLFVVAPQLKPWSVHEGLYGLIVNMLIVVASCRRSSTSGEDTFLDIASTRAK